LLIRNTCLSFNVQLLDHAAWTVDDIAARGSTLTDVAARLCPEPIPGEVDMLGCDA